MKKATINFSLASIMFLLGLAQAITGFVLWIAFPAGGGGGGRWGGGGSGLTFWTLSKHTWIDIHDWVAVALLVTVAIHLILHRKWILRMLKKSFKQSIGMVSRTGQYLPDAAGE